MEIVGPGSDSDVHSIDDDSGDDPRGIPVANLEDATLVIVWPDLDLFVSDSVPCSRCCCGTYRGLRASSQPRQQP